MTASSYEALMLDLINAERKKTGATALVWNERLANAAADHSRWMINNDRFSHTGANGSTAQARMKAAGYVFSGSWTCGENISWCSTRGAPGYDDEVRLLHTNLMNSPGHRANILNQNYREIGLGFEVGEYAGWNGAFVTQDFAKSGAVQVPVPPTEPFLKWRARITPLGDVVLERGDASIKFVATERGQATDADFQEAIITIRSAVNSL